MKAFLVKHNDKEIRFSLSEGAFGVMISNKEYHLTVSCSGMDGQGLCHYWYQERINDGDVISIEFHDNDVTALSASFVRDVTDEEKENKLMLENYFRLKRELEEE